MIEVLNVTKDFKIYKRQKGLKNTIKSLFRREHILKHAVKDISFNINRGEVVGYVGPNGAGKSTTIKMLTGILTPTSGNILIDGLVPYKNRIENAKKFGVVFGQRSQLYWDLPVCDSFDLHKRIYDIDKDTFKHNVELFTEILEMREFLEQPVRQLSLGQKMRANIAISLLHDPKIVYLDEPTIGLDIVAKSRIRDFILEVNHLKGTTFVLTTHDMVDIEKTCSRLILIDKGTIRFDGQLNDFKRRFGEKFTIVVEMDELCMVNHQLLQTVRVDNGKTYLMGDKEKISIAQAINFLTHNYSIHDLKIEENNIESILTKIYREKNKA